MAIGDDVIIRVMEIDEDRRQVRIGIEAPAAVSVHREEVFNRNNNLPKAAVLTSAELEIPPESCPNTGETRQCTRLWKLLREYGAVFLCPGCGGNYLHLAKVRFERDEDVAVGSHITVEKGALDCDQRKPELSKGWDRYPFHL